MSDASLGISELFPSPTLEAWRAIVERDLKGRSYERLIRTREGVRLEPLHTCEAGPAPDAAGFPGSFPFTRGARPLGQHAGGWLHVQEHAQPEPGANAAAVREDLSRGAPGVYLRLDQAARRGLGVAAAGELRGRAGVAIQRLADLEAVFAEVPLEDATVFLDAGAGFSEAAALLCALWERRGVAPAAARGAFGADPLGSLARAGDLPGGLDAARQRAAQLAQACVADYPGVRALRVGSEVYHDAGASEVQSLAFAMATGVDYLRALTDAGLELDHAAGQLAFGISVPSHFLLGIAKLRAARTLWARVIQACGGGDSAGAAWIHARTARRSVAGRDPWVNLLRATVAGFAAAVGGADALSCTPYDDALGLPDATSRRWARNTQVILQEEAQLHRVIDPAGGSYALEALTERLARGAWSLLQAIEGAGGMAQALRSGWVHEQVAGARDARREQLARRKQQVLGLSAFPNLGEELPARPAPALDALHSAEVPEDAGDPPADFAAARAAAGTGASLGALAAGWAAGAATTLAAPFALERLGAGFELLRARSDALLAASGRRPRVFLACLGPLAEHNARSTWTRNLLAAGGLEALGPEEGFPDAPAALAAFRDSGCGVCVLSGADARYAELVAELGPALTDAGATWIVLAGRPGEREEAYRAAGVTRFAHLGCDVQALLDELLTEVLSEQEAAA